MGLIPDKSDNHAVEIEEEHDEVKAELDKGLLLVDVELAEDLGSIQEVGVLENLLHVPGEQRQVENESDPVAIDQEQESQETVHGSLRDNVRVQTVAEIDRVDIVAVCARTC